MNTDQLLALGTILALLAIIVELDRLVEAINNIKGR